MLKRRSPRANRIAVTLIALAAAVGLCRGMARPEMGGAEGRAEIGGSAVPYAVPITYAVYGPQPSPAGAPDQGLIPAPLRVAVRSPIALQRHQKVTVASQRDPGESASDARLRDLEGLF